MNVPGPKTLVTFYKTMETSGATDHFGNPVYKNVTTTPVEAMVEALTGDDRFIGGKLDNPSDYRLFVDVTKYTLRIIEGMQVDIPLGGERETRRFKVTFVDNPGLCNDHLEIAVADMGV